MPKVSATSQPVPAQARYPCRIVHGGIVNRLGARTREISSVESTPWRGFVCLPASANPLNPAQAHTAQWVLWIQTTTTAPGPGAPLVTWKAAREMATLKECLDLIEPHAEGLADEFRAAPAISGVSRTHGVIEMAVTAQYGSSRARVEHVCLPLSTSPDHSAR